MAAKRLLGELALLVAMAALFTLLFIVGDLAVYGRVKW